MSRYSKSELTRYFVYADLTEDDCVPFFRFPARTGNGGLGLTARHPSSYTKITALLPLLVFGMWAFYSIQNLPGLLNGLFLHSIDDSGVAVVVLALDVYAITQFLSVVSYYRYAMKKEKIK